MLYVPNTRVKRGILCYTSLARGLKGRIRRSDIRVLPKSSFVLYVPSTRVKKELYAIRPWHEGSWERTGSSGVAFDIGDFRWECTGVSGLTHEGEFMWEYTGLPCLVLANDFVVEAYRFVRLNFQKRICIESIQGSLAWLSEIILCGSVPVCSA